MKKKLHIILFTLILFLSNSIGIINPLIVESETNFDASQFVESVNLSNGDGPIGSNKISDSSSVNVTYHLIVGDGSTIDTTIPYTMPIPSELKYSTNTPVELFSGTGQKLGEVTIINGVASIYFEEIVKSLKNVTLYFNYWSGFNKGMLDYDTGNDLVFPTKDNPINSININFSKSSSGGGSGTSAISKNLTYRENNIVNWIVTVNNGGYEVEDSQFVDIIENTQNYVPGSTTINYRNWARSVLFTETTDLNFSDNGDGSKTSRINFGYLTSADSKNSTAVTSIVIHYQTRLIYNKDNNRYPNRAYSYDRFKLIDDVVSTATYRGQGGGGTGDETTVITGEKQWDDFNNKFKTRPENITVELVQNDQVIEEQIVQPNDTGQWQYTFQDQLKYDETGTEYVYSVKEKEIPVGYTEEVVGTTIINHYQNTETTNIVGEKQWDDYDNKFKTRPENITVELVQNDQVVEEQIVQPNDTRQWQYTFLNQLKYDEVGAEYIYSVREKEVPLGYTMKIDGYTIVNTLDSSKIMNNNQNKIPVSSEKGAFPQAGEKESRLFFFIGLCEVILIFILRYLLKNRDQFI